jgi:hypothetical protein
MVHGDQIPVTPQEMIDVTDSEIMEMIQDAGFSVEDVENSQTIDRGKLPPHYPPISLQLWSYKEALIKWNKAGRPTRTQEEVEKIHEEFCDVPCEWYDTDQKRCRGCGCKVTVGSIAILNKLKMATEHCPKDKW